MVTLAGPTPDVYALRPEEVEITPDGRFLVEAAGETREVAGHVLHIRGIEQFESPYGISILEPILALYHTQQAFREPSEFAARVVEDYQPGSPEYVWAQRTLAASQASTEDFDSRLTRLLWFPRTWLPSAREGLYFPGQERM